MSSQILDGIIFVGGVHGVGKTTFSQMVSDALKIPTYSAGSLIREHLGETPSHDKKVANVSGNQDVLVEAVRALKLVRQRIILDGHFCLRDKKGLISPVPLRTYQALNVRLAIVVREEPELIQARLHERDGTPQACEEIRQFQDAEQSWASEIAIAMRIPLRVLRSGEVHQAIEYIQLLGKA